MTDAQDTKTDYPVIYLAVVNSDSTEGRGPMLIRGIFSTLQGALEAVKGKGVYGVGDGEVYFAYIDGPFTGIADQNKKIYGSVRTDTGWGSGFTGIIAQESDLELLPKPEPVDPEYVEYLRLKNKFDKK
jgi:hypothetical protein